MVANNLALTRSKEIMRQVLFQLVAEFKQSNNHLVIYAKSSLKGLIKDHAARGGIGKVTLVTAAKKPHPKIPTHCIVYLNQNRPNMRPYRQHTSDSCTLSA